MIHLSNTTQPLLAHLKGGTRCAATDMERRNQSNKEENGNARNTGTWVKMNVRATLYRSWYENIFQDHSAPRQRLYATPGTQNNSGGNVLFARH